jgi:transketolase
MAISPLLCTAHWEFHKYFELDDAIALFRKFGSIYEGHIERTVPGVEWTTGNLGQGLSAGAGFAMASVINKTPYKVFVLMGDGEQQKGQISEARRFAVKYQLNNLCAIVDYNRLQISGSIEDVMPQQIRANWESDGWAVIETDGHDFAKILDSLEEAAGIDKPVMILAHTVMGKGVSFMENLAKYHGSTLTESQLDEALKELGAVNKLRDYRKARTEFVYDLTEHKTAQFELKGDLTAGQPIVYDTENDNRSAWGNAIADLAKINEKADTALVVVDCDLAASVKTGDFAKVAPDRFIQAGIMEHNAAVLSGALSASGIQTFWSDFGMFGIDEVYNMHRLNDINHTNLKVAVTHVGIDVGEDGKTHQCIDYIGLARNLYNFKLICPADSNQTDRIIRSLINKPGNYFITMGRSKLPVIRNEEGAIFYDMGYNYEYGKEDQLRIGNHGTVFVTGPPVGRALKAIDSLRDEGIYLNLYYVSSPLEISDDAIEKAVSHGVIFSIEDHNVHSGLECDRRQLVVWD